MVTIWFLPRISFRAKRNMCPLLSNRVVYIIDYTYVIYIYIYITEGGKAVSGYTESIISLFHPYICQFLFVWFSKLRTTCFQSCAQYVSKVAHNICAKLRTPTWGAHFH